MALITDEERTVVATRMYTGRNSIREHSGTEHVIEKRGVGEEVTFVCTCGQHWWETIESLTRPGLL